MDLQVESVESGQVVVRMPNSAQTARPDGVISGQALCSLADSAMVLAIANEIGEFCPVSTVDLHLTFLGAIRDADAIATAKVDRIGSSLAFASMVVTSATDKARIAATARATFAMPRTSKSKEVAA